MRAMLRRPHIRTWIFASAISCAVLLALFTGCQVQEGGGGIGGTSLHVDDDVIYYPPGPEFQQQREAAAKKAFQQDAETQQTP